MSEESPHFNELFVQEDKKDREYNLDSNLLAEGREHAEEFDRKIVGFDSIDDLFSSLGSPRLKEGISKNQEEVAGHQRVRAIVEQQAEKNSSNKLPNITINYSQPSVRDSSLNNKMGALPTKWTETKAYKKKIIYYQERIVKIPIEKEVIEYYEVENIVNHEPKQRNIMTINQPKQQVEEKFNILTTKNSPFEEKPTQKLMKQSDPSLLQKNKSDPSITNQIQAIKFQNPNHFSNLQQKTSYNQQTPSKIRFVTSDNYDYAQRRIFLHQIDSKMQYLKQMQAKLLKQ